MSIIRIRNKKRFVLLGTLTAITALIILISVCNIVISSNAKHKLYTDTNTIPYNKVGLLLGTGKYAAGEPNPFYNNRIAAAVQLLKAGKIKYILASGDNSRQQYSEVDDMRGDLIAAGVDSTLIFLDYAGFRTFDSMVRLKEIFGQQAVTIISQPFHNERALYMARKEGINAVAFNAKDVGGQDGYYVQLREKLARVKVFIDYWFGKQPRFLGEKVIIPA